VVASSKTGAAMAMKWDMIATSCCNEACKIAA